MKTKSKSARKPFGERLIASVEQGVDALRSGKELPATFVSLPQRVRKASAKTPLDEDSLSGSKPS